MSSIGRRRAQAQTQNSGYDVWPDIYDFIFYNILPLIILLVYGPEKKSWFEMDTKVLIGMFSFVLCITLIYWGSSHFGVKRSLVLGYVIILWYDITWWIAFGTIHIEHYILMLILMIFLTVVPIILYINCIGTIKNKKDNIIARITGQKMNRVGQIVGLLNFIFLIIYQSLWFNICFPTSPVVTKSIFGITLLSVGRVLFYMANDDSGEEGFFNGFKKVNKTFDENNEGENNEGENNEII
ncbi:hypothetical protein Glove_151g161 [Diversispora epigaea]|uniref:Uncharacterized protein n=1 Tax=Diversispora epigaea TaxID=1348612 RepID=A0A397IZI0_9GLOM|nr:hypothetical protein Glove_151g161 [Diversispora epigaea]